MRHRADELDRRLAAAASRHARRLLAVARAQAPHPGVELDVHAPASARRHRVDERLAPRDDVGARGQRGVELLGAQRAEDEQRPVDAVRAQLRGLVRGGHREPGGAAGQRRAGGGQRPVPVAVGLDHRAQLGAARSSRRRRATLRSIAATLTRASARSGLTADRG